MLKATTIGPYRLAHGNCVPVGRELSDQCHALVAASPYGTNFFLHSGGGTQNAAMPRTRFVGEQFRMPGDNRPHDPRHPLKIAGKRPVILWGGKHYASRCSVTGWLAWQKLPDTQLGRSSFSHGDFAWYSWNRRSRFKRYTWSCTTLAGSLPANGKTRFQPTQNPVEIMRWCIEMLPARDCGCGDIVIDAYLGSGSTAIAAMQAGVKFIGVEMSETWFDVACERGYNFWRNPATGVS